MTGLFETIEQFVAACGEPVLDEPGDGLLPLRSGCFSLERRDGHVLLQAWDERRNLTRRVIAIESSTRARLVLRVERFGKKTGTLSVIDRKRAGALAVGRRAARLELRERFRRFLLREFSQLQIVELSAEANLEYSLSPAYPRALLKHGATGWAAIAAGPDNAAGVLSFGLIWLDYLRRRERSSAVRGLILLLPAGCAINTCLRLRWLDSTAAEYTLFVYSKDDFAQALDWRDHGNIETHLETCRRNPPGGDAGVLARLAGIEGVETVERADGSISFRVHGLEFARLAGGALSWGLETKRPAGTSNGSEIESLARELARVRRAGSQDQFHPLFVRGRETWLESQVRSDLEQLDPALCGEPVYGQVPAFAAGQRDVIDLLAADRSGRAAVIELKVSQDIHLPLQALDYWMRVKWHLDRGEFSAHGYFPGVRLRQQPPRLLLVAPALEFHPSNERVLRFFSPEIEAERLGVGMEWQKKLKVVYRM